jgi:hypothetical protein
MTRSNPRTRKLSSQPRPSRGLVLLAAVIAIFQLESSCLLAGDVTASIDEVSSSPNFSFAKLTIQGDNQSNDIRIVERNVGEFVIEGLNGTTVNGQPSVTLQIPAEYWGWYSDVNLGLGDDSLIYDIGNDWALGHFRDVETGQGDDVVVILATAGLERTSISTGNGNDTVVFDVQASILSGNIDIDTGFGDDDVLFDSTAAGGMTWIAYSSIDLSMGHGADKLQFNGSFLFNSGPEDFQVEFGQGDDELVGDATGSLRGDFRAIGEQGFDTVVNADYFSISESYFSEFESIDNE